MSTTKTKDKVKLPVSAHLLRIFYLFIAILGTYCTFAVGLLMSGFTGAYLARQYGIKEDSDFKIINILIWFGPILFATLALVIVCYFAIRGIWTVSVRKFKAVRVKYLGTDNDDGGDVGNISGLDSEGTSGSNLTKSNKSRSKRRRHK